MNGVPRSQELEELRLAELETPVGGKIENYCERFSVGEEERPVFERFLSSRNLDNRSSALSALTQRGKFGGYEADALLLHFQSRDGIGSPEEFAAINQLRTLSELGSKSAERVLEHLDTDPYVRKLYGYD